MANKVLIFGGIGAGSTVAMAIVDATQNGNSEYEFAGYINDKDDLTEIDGYPIMGGKNDIQRFIDEGYYFINTVFKIDGQKERISLFESFGIPEERLAVFVHPRAYVAPNVKLAPGCVILPNATVSSNVQFGLCCRVMTGAMVGHDNTIGDYSFFAANSCLGSHIEIGKAAYFGLNCTVGGKLSVGDYGVVGMGSVVTKNVDPYSIVAGNPAKHLRFVLDKEQNL